MLPHLHRGSVAQLPTRLPGQDRKSSSAHQFGGIRSPEWPGGSLNVQSNGTNVVSPGGSIPPFGTKTSRPEEHKVTGTGSTNVASGSLGVTMRRPSPISTLDSWTRES